MTLAQLILIIIGLVCFIIGLYHLYRMIVFDIEPPERYGKFVIFTICIIAVLAFCIAVYVYHLLSQIKVF